MDSPVNIFDLSNENQPTIEKEFTTVEKRFKDTNESTVLESFLEHLKNNFKLSINGRLPKAEFFKNQGFYPNTFDFFNGEYQKIIHDSPNYGVKRIAFSEFFEDGIKFNYAALNTGEIGLSTFG